MVRVIVYRLVGVSGADSHYRLLTTVCSPPSAHHRLLTTVLELMSAPAGELAALNYQRCEIESVRDELKTHLKG